MVVVNGSSPTAQSDPFRDYSTVESHLSELQSSEHQKSNSRTYTPGQFLDHTPSFVTYNTIFYGVQLSEHPLVPTCSDN